MKEEVWIAAMGRQGDGVAETPQGRVHVPFTLPGERVQIERDGDRGTLLRIIATSAERIEPRSAISANAAPARSAIGRKHHISRGSVRWSAKPLLANK